jgi:hypothetical protein
MEIGSAFSPWQNALHPVTIEGRRIFVIPSMRLCAQQRSLLSAISQNMNKQVRIERYQRFQEFLNESSKTFAEIAREDEDHEFYDREYGLCIVPGGWNGGVDRRVLEVFYGARPYEAYSNQPAVKREETSGGGATSGGFFTESGARLVYGLTAKGTVNCTLIPAQAQGAKSSENAIMLNRGVEPGELLEGKLPRKHWRSFMAYMKVTSLDGDPSQLDKLHVLYMRFTKLRYVNEKVSLPMWLVGGNQILKSIFTVALSGALLTVITLCLSDNTVRLDQESTTVLRSLAQMDGKLNSSIEFANTAAVTLNATLQRATAVASEEGRALREAGERISQRHRSKAPSRYVVGDSQPSVEPLNQPNQ